MNKLFTVYCRRQYYYLILLLGTLINLPVLSQAQSPGGVGSTNLKLWVKADVTGNMPASWNDNSPVNRPLAAATGTTFSAADATHNFYPFATGFASNRYFQDLNRTEMGGGGNNNGTGGEGHTPNIFAAVRYTYSGSTASTTASSQVIGIDGDVAYSAEPGFRVQRATGLLRTYRYLANPETATAASAKVASNQNSIVSWLAQSPSSIVYGADGAVDPVITQSTIGKYSGNSVRIGHSSWDTGNEWYGDIQEVIWFEQVLTEQERHRVNSYLALKYGTTLVAQPYVGSTGTVYRTAGGGYNHNVFGIGRDDNSGLYQKVSNSTAQYSSNIGKLLVGASNLITATNATHGGTLTNNTFLTFGHNNQGGLATAGTTGTGCNEVTSTRQATNAIWKSVEGGSMGSVRLSADLGAYGFNTQYTVYMLLSSDSTFSTINKIALHRNTSTGRYEANYDFNGTQFFRFEGDTRLPENLCEGNKIYSWSAQGWTYGTRSKVSTIGDQTFTVNVDDPSGAMYYPARRPYGTTANYYGQGRHLFIERSKGGTITTTLKMSKPARGASFTVYDIDYYTGGRDVVEIYGKIGGATVNPILTPSNPSSLTISGNTVQPNTNTVWNINRRAGVNVQFSNPIDEIVVVYTKTNATGYQDIRISDIALTCQEFVPPVVQPDNVYIAKEVDRDTVEVQEGFTYKFTFKNDNCTSKTINFSDILPQTAGSVRFEDGSLSTNLTFANRNSYGNTGTLSITGLVLPPGNSYMYVSAYGTLPGKIDNQGTFTVDGGINTPNPYTTSRATPGDTSNVATPVWVVKTKEDALLTVKKSVDVYPFANINNSITYDSTQQNSVIRYKFEITNPNSQPVNVTFSDNLPVFTSGAPSFVAGSLTGLASGTVNTYGGEENLAIDGLVLPASGKAIFTVDVNTGTVATGDSIRNLASVTVEENFNFLSKTYESNAVNTMIIPCDAIPKPTLSATSRSSECPVKFVSLTAAPALVTSTCPSGFGVSWHSGSPATALNKVARPDSITTNGTYYAFCKKDEQDCYSQPSDPFTVTISPLPAAPSAGITASKANICVGESATLSAACLTGQIVVWYSGTDSLGTGTSYTASPAVTTTYSAICRLAASGCQTPLDSAATSTITVQPVTPAPTQVINNSGTSNICAGQAETLTASCASGSTVVWYVGAAVAGTGSPYIVHPTATTTYTAKCRNTVTECETPTSSAVTLTVNVHPVVSTPSGVSSSAGAGTICAGTEVTLNATCGSGETVTWYVGSDSTTILSSNVVVPTVTTSYTVKCQNISTLCNTVPANKQTVTVNVSTVVPPASNIASGSPDNTVCRPSSGSATVSLTANCSAGSTPVWFIGASVAGIGSPYNASLATTTTYTAKCQSTGNSCYSASTSVDNITITVLDKPASATAVTATATTICSGQSTILSGSCTAGNTLAWYVGNTQVGTGNTLSVSPVTPTNYIAYCVNTTGCSSDASASPLFINVAPPAAPTGVSAAATSVCTGATSTTVSATCIVGLVRWYIGSTPVGDGSPLAVMPNTTTTYRAVCVNLSGGCESTSSDVTITVASCSITGTNPAVSTPSGTAVTGTANTQINPQGGVVTPYVYSAISCTGGTSVAQGTAVTNAQGGSLVVTNSATGAYTYTPSSNPSGGTENFCIEVCDSSNPANCQVFTFTVTQAAAENKISAKVFLAGPLSGTSMTKILNTSGLIPTTSPYSSDQVTTTASIITTNDITDWVLLELRSAPTAIVESKSMLLKQDGTLVNPDGTNGVVNFINTTGNFYLAIRHRNHLGVMTATAIDLSQTQTIDFTSASTATYGTHAQRTVGAVNALWAGNASGIVTGGSGENVRYTPGAGSDYSATLSFLNVNGGTSSLVSGYYNSDVNLDGITRFGGATSDITAIRNSVVNNPANIAGLVSTLLLQAF